MLDIKTKKGKKFHVKTQSFFGEKKVRIFIITFIINKDKNEDEKRIYICNILFYFDSCLCGFSRHGISSYEFLIVDENPHISKKRDVQSSILYHESTSMTESRRISVEASTSQKMATTWHQQVFALDAKYNTLRANKLPSLGT